MNSSDRSRDKNPLYPDHLSERIAAYIQADSWNESQRIVEQYPELLTDEADELLGQMIAAQDDQEPVAYLKQHRALLQRCRATGVGQAFADMMRPESVPSDLSVPAEFHEDVRSAGKATAQYRNTGDRQALDAAIAAWQRIWEDPAFETAECSFRLAAFNDGGIVFAWRYSAGGQLRDLSTAIRCLEQTVEKAPKGSHNLPTYLSNLGNGLRARFVRTGDLSDLENAVRCLEIAVEGSPKDSPDLPMFLSNLGNGLRARYARTGDPSHLKRAIHAYEQAVEKTPQGSPHLPRRLNNLSTGLHDRYPLSGELSDLEHAIRGYKQATEKAPDDSPERPGYLINLGTALNARYGRSGELSDLEQAIQAYERAVEETSPSSPKLPGRLNNLATGLRDRHTRLERPADLVGAIEAFEESCRRGTDMALEVALQAAHNWGNWASGRRKWREAAHAYNYGLEASERLFQTQLLRTSKEAWLREARELHVRAAYALARTEELKYAVEAIERGRARLLSQVLEREQAELDQLEAQEPDIYDRYVTAAGRLRFLEIQELREQLLLPPGQALTEAFRQAYDELEATVNSIRQLTGSDDLLAALAFDQIREAAADAHLVYLTATPTSGLALVVAPSPPSDQTSEVSGELVPTTSEVSAFWLDELTEGTLWERLGDYLSAYNGWRRNPRDGAARAAWLEAIDEATRWLWNAAIGPVAEALTDRDNNRVILIPTGQLGLLPLHAAWTEAPTRSTGRRYALDEIRFSYTPNARALGAARDTATSIAIPNSLLAVDNPGGSLRFSEEEVAAALDTFPRSHRLHLPDDKATLESVQKNLTQHDVWHFSTHGRAGWSEPLESSLPLADGKELTLRDLLALDAPARLAVLSACETGVPGTELPDEVIGLPTGLLQAGVAGVVASLWAVNDFSTALLMMRFYQCWREEEQEPPGALRSAQRWLRDATNADLVDYFQRHLPEFAEERLPRDVADRGYRRFALEDPDERPFVHPFYWAGFYYTGV